MIDKHDKLKYLISEISKIYKVVASMIKNLENKDVNFQQE